MDDIAREDLVYLLSYIFDFPDASTTAVLLASSGSSTPSTSTSGILPLTDAAGDTTAIVYSDAEETGTINFLTDTVGDVTEIVDAAATVTESSVVHDSSIRVTIPRFVTIARFFNYNGISAS